MHDDKDVLQHIIDVRFGHAQAARTAPEVVDVRLVDLVEGRRHEARGRFSQRHIVERGVAG